MARFAREVCDAVFKRATLRFACLGVTPQGSVKLSKCYPLWGRLAPYTPDNARCASVNARCAGQG